MDRLSMCAPRVLYIDGDPTLGRLVQKNLARRGFTAELASSGAEGARRDSIPAQGVTLIPARSIANVLLVDDETAVRFGRVWV